MREPIILPVLGLVEEVTIVQWLVEDGQSIRKGEVLLLIETEKTQVEMESPADGVVHVEVRAGPELVPATAVLGYIESEDEPG
jgi:pyruvate dehydrogenase E2 component (dihydrolipoamide acetyltransferase)